MGMFKKAISRLGPDDIEVKVKQVGEKGAVALLYKTARTDMRVLDECIGPENWQDSYREIKGNLYCTISIYNPDTGEWIGKTDCGVESREDDEGNQKKGEASDAFKRAGFKWGIGRELYTAPFIFLSLPTKEVTGPGGKKRYELKDRFSRFAVRSIEYAEDGSIRALALIDQTGNEVFRYGNVKEPTPLRAAKPIVAKKATDAQMDTLRAELARTGWSIGKALANISAKFAVKVVSEPDVTAEQADWLVALLRTKSDSGAERAAQ